MSDRIRKIVIAGVLGAISALLGWTHWGFIPWVTGAALTIMHVPVIIGAVIEGPVVGAAIGLIFGGFSLLQAAIAPTGPTDVWFTNPLLSILPRLFIGPAAWLVWRALQRWPKAGLAVAVTAGPLFVLALAEAFGYNVWWGLGLLLIENSLVVALAWAVLQHRPEVGLIAAGIAGSLTNTLLVLGVIGLLGFLPWAALPVIIVGNGLPEAAASAIITVAVVAAWEQIEIGGKRGADL
jgi:uncharacterized membrane protein